MRGMPFGDGEQEYRSELVTEDVYSLSVGSYCLNQRRESIESAQSWNRRWRLKAQVLVLANVPPLSNKQG